MSLVAITLSMKVMVIKTKHFQLKIDPFSNRIEPYLNDLIDNLKNPGECKINLTMAINFFF